MKHIYQTEGTCSTEISFELENNIVKNISFTGGCNGNLKAIAVLVEGMTADNAIEKLEGITCGRRPTSCADQLAKALKTVYNR
ncbi:MAG: TIGR03905 family TSCPD domain-containing protein [Oscillospiraceae bacterium]|nr:TIGR03905 family TSCPD domain-containing protein [Oscillospiraceae bacterium]